MAVTGWASGDSAATSQDALWGGRVAYEQPARGTGYRVSQPPFLVWRGRDAAGWQSGQIGSGGQVRR